MPPRKKTKAFQSSALSPGVSGAGANVPPELLLQIIENAAKPLPNYTGNINYLVRALCAMCRVNKHWHAIARESLHRCLRFIDKPEKMAKLRRTVVNSPTIAGLIIELDVHVIGEKRLPTTSAAHAKAAAKRQQAGQDLWDVLEVLTALKTLKIWRYAESLETYKGDLSHTLRLNNLSTVRSLTMVYCDTEPAVVLTRSMTALEDFSLVATGSRQGDVRLLENTNVHLAHLSVAGSCGHDRNDWDNWLKVVQHSKDTLHTLELDDMDDIPITVLQSALEIVAPSILRLFYSSHLPELHAVLLSALPKMTQLISLRTSLPTAAALSLVPPSIVELGLGHRPQGEGHALQETLLRIWELPYLKVLWLPGLQLSPDWRRVEEEAKPGPSGERTERVWQRFKTWKLLSGQSGLLPRYGSEEEIPYIAMLRVVPGVYATRVKTGAAKVFDPEVSSRLASNRC
ncbi:hypothetical protein HWV62_11249 [Athelia sp. TMB]|nr:hypothetical protein HWV62_11249 [Athelia sp. TMB]